MLPSCSRRSLWRWTLSKSSCVHHWVIESDAPINNQPGRCKKCGKRRVFTPMEPDPSLSYNRPITNWRRTNNGQRLN